MNIQMRRFVAPLLLIVPMLMGPSIANANLITNPGFETGTLAGWTCVGADLCGITTDGPKVHTGTFAFQGFDNTGFATLSQTIATTAGLSYGFSAWSNTNVQTAVNILRYSLDGGPILGIPISVAFLQTTDLFIASGPTALIAFFFETDGGTGTWHIDDVSVEVVPLPAAFPLFAGGLGLLGLMGWRKQRKAQAA